MIAAAPHDAGVYVITNTVNGTIYVGSSINVRRRMHNHQRELRDNRHGNRKLQNSVNKYGMDSFIFEKVVSVLSDDKETILFNEQLLIDTLKPQLNLSPTAGSTLGVKHSEESRAKHSAAMKEVQNRPEVKAKVSAASKEAWARPEVKAKISAASKEARNRPEVRAKHSAALKETWARPEVKAKMSVAMKEVLNRPEVKAKMAAGIAATWHDPAIKAARGECNGVSVTVDGVTSGHRSTRAGFAAYGLPDGSHIKFRKKLKAAGELTFTHDGRDYRFTLIV
jgi:group I intron endonuclease